MELDERSKIVKEVIDEETNWRSVFKSMGIEINEEASAELEFRKALYKHKFDRTWCSDVTKIENEHYAIMGAIVAFTKVSSPEALTKNPLDDLSKSAEYKYEINIPFVKELSDELLTMLCQKFRYQFGRVSNEFEVKHQRLIDSIQTGLNQNMYKGNYFKPGGVASGSHTGKSIRSFLSKDSGAGSKRRA